MLYFSIIYNIWLTVTRKTFSTANINGRIDFTKKSLKLYRFFLQYIFNFHKKIYVKLYISDGNWPQDLDSGSVYIHIDEFSWVYISHIGPNIQWTIPIHGYLYLSKIIDRLWGYEMIKNLMLNFLHPLSLA